MNKLLEEIDQAAEDGIQLAIERAAAAPFKKDQAAYLNLSVFFALIQSKIEDYRESPEDTA